MGQNIYFYFIQRRESSITTLKLYLVVFAEKKKRLWILNHLFIYLNIMLIIKALS